MVLTGLWKQSSGEIQIEGNALRQEAPQSRMVQPNDTGTQFLQTASRKNCCFIQTTLRNGWSGPEHC